MIPATTPIKAEMKYRRVFMGAECRSHHTCGCPAVNVHGGPMLDVVGRRTRSEKRGTRNSRANVPAVRMAVFVLAMMLVAAAACTTPPPPGVDDHHHAGWGG